MTIVEKIIARHAGRKRVEAGETLFVRCDLAMGSEIIFPQVLDTLEILGWNDHILRDRIALINGHLVSTREAATGTLVAVLDHFATKHGIERYFQVGKHGDCQTILALNGLVGPGDFLVGSDQHFTTFGAIGALASGVGGIDLAAAWTTGETWLTVPRTALIRLTGRLNRAVVPKDLALHILAMLGLNSVRDMALEFTGDGLEQLSVDDRFMLCNLVVETGAKFAVMPVDNPVREYLGKVGFKRPVEPVTPDTETPYAAEFTFDLGQIVPMVAAPYMPTEGMPVDRLKEIPVDQVLIGTCTNGRIEDFRLVAKMFEKHESFPGVRLGLYPSSHQAVRDLVDEGLALLFTRRGAAISPPSCQACLGSGPSLLGEGETGLYTTNRNYRGRHGPPTAKVFLSGPLVAAASAISGVITDPREFL